MADGGLLGVNTGILLGAASGILGSFSASMPKPSEISRTSPNDDAAVKDIRHAEITALTAALLLGTLSSLATRSPAPILVAGVVVGTMIGVSEWSLRN